MMTPIVIFLSDISVNLFTAPSFQKSKMKRHREQLRIAGYPRPFFRGREAETEEQPKEEQDTAPPDIGVEVIQNYLGCRRRYQFVNARGAYHRSVHRE
jgi:hypothetical protein